MKEAIAIALTIISTFCGTDIAEEIQYNIENIDSKYTIERDYNTYFVRNTANKPMIIDTDIGSDVDDACCLRIATQLDTEAVIDLKAVCASYSGDNAIRAVDGLLTHDRIDNVLIGYCTADTPLIDGYTDVMEPFASGKYEVLDAVSVYRKVLAESEEPVDIVTTGYLTNIENLLKSEPDCYSELNGVELIKEKVGQLYIVGGSYTEGYDNNFYAVPQAAYAAWYTNEYWPMTIIYFINNQANILVCGDQLEAIDATNNDIVSKALRRYGTEFGRVAWDPYAVALASYGFTDECQSNIQRANTVIDMNNGHNVFTLDENGKHYIVFRNEGIQYEYYNNMLDSILLKKYYEIYG